MDGFQETPTSDDSIGMPRALTVVEAEVRERRFPPLSTGLAGRRSATLDPLPGVSADRCQSRSAPGGQLLVKSGYAENERAIMPEKTLIGEFHADHAKVVQALIDLRSAIQARDPARIRATLNEANQLVGPHFKFEELYLYPSLVEFIGEAGMKRLLTEHDGVFRSVAALVDLAAKPAWSDADAEAAAANLELIREHPVTCDGLSLYIERLPEAVQAALLSQMEAQRREGTALLQYRKERL
ncbi:MAG: hemerythrin domain-containing protein [Armatimonadetes bacterium]|nr:hemerythrin domain-containing protein [Armatimonadota bacterium]